MSALPAVGIGYDSHRFAPGRPLVLGGLTIPHEQGLAGHSDGDAVCHAITDALLGAAGLGDIGAHFPPDDERWRDADSLALLRRVVVLLGERALVAGNVDVTVVCEAPRLGPHREPMRARLADALGIEPERVSVKGKTNEGRGWIGRGEGIAVMAVVLVVATGA
ncbi:MAG TPA: 2-C-methyl-D-erythritol 2,4-cyclodiphosphate synthase [Longimicrobiales bacterium]|nr:2-C-methyl-D-erythritol 2,4-cyclodiphosphate synthase [Longimicrobiales bacterium]